MALTAFQRDVCRLLAGQRKLSGESYVAGGAALNEILKAPRLSRDLDLFHDSQQGLDAAWQADRALLLARGYEVRVDRDRPGFVEAEIRLQAESVIIQWTRDSAYRFFPLVEHEELGLTMHPFDLATNKVLALVGRLEVRDFIDAIACDEKVQPLGYLAWAACGKDPGFSPLAILEQAARSGHHAAAEFSGLDFEGTPPDPAALSQRWRLILESARQILDRLPAEQAGKAVLTKDGELFRGRLEELTSATADGRLVYHTGTIRGAFPLLARLG